MPIGLPNIDIIFKQKAVSAVQRSSGGIACIIVKDDTITGTSITQYNDITGLAADKANFTTDNYAVLEDVFLGVPSKLIVCKIATTGTVTDALSQLVNTSFNWIGAIIAESTDQNALVTWVKAQNLVRTKKIKAVTFKATTTDDEHIVNLINDKVKRKTDSAEIDGHLYVGRLVGLFAGLSMNMSATYYKLTDLESVSSVIDVEISINSGNLVLMLDGEDVVIARAVNSLQTLGEDKTQDMQFIIIVESMDLMYEDIKTTYKNSYVSKYKNKLNNQMMFLSAVNTYFKTLAKQDILDIEYNNNSYIDIEAQRDAWLGIGKTEASTWNDITVKKNTFRTNLFLGADVKILNYYILVRY